MTHNTISDALTIPGGEGTLLANRYRVVRQLGQGGMGSVWLAEDTKLRNRLFAIKMLPSVLVRNKKAYRQLGDEALVAMKLTHPNIVTLRAFEEDNGNPFLVMDYIDGQTLDDYLAEKGKISEDEAIKLLKPIAAALDYAHDERVVHRDIKPANVMIRNDGHPFILDFGIAREIQETMTRVTGKLSSGTLLYMSPEQLRGWSPTAAQDIYSFSAMVYECVAGHPPFYRGAVEDQIKNETPESLPASIAIANSVMAGLEKDPKARPSSCVDVLVSHGRTCPRPWSRHGTIGDDKTIEFEPEPSESIRRNWAWWWIAGSSIVFALLVAGGFLWKVSSSHDIATGPSVPVVPAVAVLPVNVEPAVPSPSEQAHIEEEQDRLKAEAMHLRNEIAAQYCLATNAFNKVAQYRKQPEGFRQHLEKVDLFWESSSSIVLSVNATSEQLANVLVSVSNVVVGIQGEAQWIVENLALRDEILSVRENAYSIRDSFANVEGTHWQTLQSYIAGTNSLTIASERLAKGELVSALESISIATNHLQAAYSDELKFIDGEKKRIAEEKLKVEAQKLADEARTYTNSLEQIALLRRDASNEYAKIEAFKNAGFASEVLTVAANVWGEFKELKDPKTLTESRAVLDRAKDYAASIKRKGEELQQRKDSYISNTLDSARLCRHEKQWRESVLRCDEVLKFDPSNEEALSIRAEVIEKQKQASRADNLRIEDISITASHKQYDENKSRFDYHGKVRMSIGKFALSADKVLIPMDDMGNILFIVARRNVLLTTEDVEARASNHVGIDVKTGKIVLSGDVYAKLKTGQVQRGDQLTLSHKFTKMGGANENK